MAEGVSIAWRAARIRSPLKGESVSLKFEMREGRSVPLDPSPNQ
jgi:hypothetical protein